HDYTFTDSSVTPGFWYYRLRQISQDSTSNILSPISINVLTGVSEENLPTGYVVSQNYPNPFNPATTISFGLPVKAHVRLELFNTLGQSVGVIVDSDIQAGYHSVNFDASRLASGVYLYRLTAGSFTQTRKLIFAK
ncbi:MAG: T9SS type A sorting domain-containing protein, partial [Bacteroidota bacterium]